MSLLRSTPKLCCKSSLCEVVPWLDALPRNPNSPLYEDFNLLIRIEHLAFPMSFILFCIRSARAWARCPKPYMHPHPKSLSSRQISKIYDLQLYSNSCLHPQLSLLETPSFPSLYHFFLCTIFAQSQFDLFSRTMSSTQVRCIDPCTKCQTTQVLNHVDLFVAPLLLPFFHVFAHVEPQVLH
jgi:hypothetical protein